ncbi:MAG: sensor histidine kinase [Caldicoprobacterales bacterium]
MFDRFVNKIKGLRYIFVCQQKRINTKDILYLYRYLSWFFTSIFYLLTQPNYPIIFEVGVIITLFGAAKILTDLYIKFSNNHRSLEIAILVETLGITLLLIPTGGLDSPFIWYALNPVLVAASFLPLYFCWINLLFYLVSFAIISFTFFRGSINVSELIQNNAYVILVFVLITLIVQMLSRLTKKLNQQTMLLKEQGEKLESMNQRLRKSNRLYKESLDHIISLYQVVETFHLGDNQINICNTFAYYASKLTKSQLAFVWKVSDIGKGGRVWVYSNINFPIKEKLVMYLSNQWSSIRYEEKLIEFTVDGCKFLVMNIRSSSRSYGLIGIQIDKDNIIGNRSNKLYLKQLSFLSNLLGAILEGQHLKKLEDQLLIIEEQNRIANEIHDSVSQRLFSIVCGIAAITKKLDKDNEELINLFELIRKSADLAMNELRSSIYDLSSKKKGEKPFVQMIKEYLDNFGQLHSIEISSSITGDEDLVSSQLKRALYRIICEATGNSVYHGKCRHLRVTLTMRMPSIHLTIEDDGKGFDVDDIQTTNGSGLGIRNMKNLVLSYNGNIDIDSKLGRSTKIIINIPVHKEHNKMMEESAI